MDHSDSHADVRKLVAELAATEDTKEKMEQMKETLQNKEQQQQEEIERLQASKSKQQQKHTYPKKKQKQDIRQIPIVQLSQTTLTVIQALHPTVHQTYTTFSWTKALCLTGQEFKFKNPGTYC